jgi:hypothetical protein
MPQITIGNETAPEPLGAVGIPDAGYDQLKRAWVMRFNKATLVIDEAEQASRYVTFNDNEREYPFATVTGSFGGIPVTEVAFHWVRPTGFIVVLKNNDGEVYEIELPNGEALMVPVNLERVSFISSFSLFIDQPAIERMRVNDVILDRVAVPIDGIAQWRKNQYLLTDYGLGSFVLTVATVMSNSTGFDFDQQMLRIEKTWNPTINGPAFPFDNYLVRAIP